MSTSGSPSPRSNQLPKRSRIRTDVTTSSTTGSTSNGEQARRASGDAAAAQLVARNRARSSTRTEAPAEASRGRTWTGGAGADDDRVVARHRAIIARVRDLTFGGPGRLQVVDGHGAPPRAQDGVGAPALVLVVVFWAASFSAIKALLDRGVAAPDIAILRYVVAAPGFALLLWSVGGLPGLAGRDAVRLALAGVAVVTGYHVPEHRHEVHDVGDGGAGGRPLPRADPPPRGGPRPRARRARRIVGLAVAFAGVAVVVLLGAGAELSFANAKGPLIVIGAPVAFALYNVLLQPLLQQYGLLALTAASSLVGMLGLVPFVRPSTVDAVAEMSASSAALILYLGIVYPLRLRGLERRAARARADAGGVLHLRDPALAVLMGALFLDELITVWLAVGGALILGGVALAQRSRAG